jgi:hypothetical protein
MESDRDGRAQRDEGEGMDINEDAPVITRKTAQGDFALEAVGLSPSREVG